MHAINGSGRSPTDLSIEDIHAAGIIGERFPYGSPHAVTVPGAVGAWTKMKEVWSGSDMSMETILEVSTAR